MTPEWERDARDTEQDAYDTGYANGYSAAQAQTDATAYEYARHLRSLTDRYSAGFIDGFDAYAVECGAEEPTDDEISEFYLNL